MHGLWEVCIGVALHAWPRKGSSLKRLQCSEYAGGVGVRPPKVLSISYDFCKNKSNHVEICALQEGRSDPDLLDGALDEACLAFRLLCLLLSALSLSSLGTLGWCFAWHLAFQAWQF